MWWHSFMAGPSFRSIHSCTVGRFSSNSACPSISYVNNHSHTHTPCQESVSLQPSSGRGVFFFCSAPWIQRERIMHLLQAAAAFMLPDPGKSAREVRSLWSGWNEPHQWRSTPTGWCPSTTSEAAPSLRSINTQTNRSHSEDKQLILTL